MLDTKNERKIIIIDPTVVVANTKRRIAAYCRVSSSSDEQLDSFAAQMDYYGKLIAEYDDWELVDIYADEGISALGMTKRDEFNRLMRDARKGKIDHIITKSISRFSRNTKECLESVRALREIGVSIAFEKESIDTTEMGGEMFLAMFSGAAQQESISISNNARIGCRMRMKNGTYTLPNTPLGYQMIDKQLVEDDSEAETIKFIFAQYLSGHGLLEIAKELTQQQVKTKTGSTQWGRGSVLYVIRNEKYIGDSLLQKSYTTDLLPFRTKLNRGEKDQYYMPDDHPAIIDKETFRKAQELLRKRQERHYTPVSTTYPLSKKIKCGHCGDVFRRRTTHEKIYWVCYQHNRSKNLCPITQISEPTLYSAFVRMYNKLRPAAEQILGTMLEQLYSLRVAQNKSNSHIVEINKEIANLTEQNHVMNDLKVKNLINSAFFIAQTNELSHKIRRLRTEKSRLMESDDDDELLTGTRNLLDFLADAPEVISEFDADTFEQMVDKIIVDSNECIKFRLINGLELTENVERTERLYT